MFINQPIHTNVQPGSDQMNQTQNLLLLLLVK